MAFYGTFADYYGDRKPSRRTRSTGSRGSRARATPKRARRKKKRARKPAGRRSRTRATRGKGVVRYDPDTLERVTVPKDSIEADEYLTAAQARTDRRARRKESLRTRKEIQRSVEPIARQAVTAGLARAQVGAGRLRTAVRAAGAAAGLSAGATAASIAAALAVGVAIGTGLRAAWRYMSTTERNARKALAFRKARLDLAKKLGRELTADEVRAMGRGFLQSIGRT